MLTWSSPLLATTFNVEDPYICKNTVQQYPQQITNPVSSEEQLINAVRAHCVDEYQRSTDILTPVLVNPNNLTATQLTYAYILHSINLNNIGSDDSCEAAKLSMAYASSGNSQEFSIRTELNYFSFCDVYDENTPHALKRLYQLSKAAVAMKSLNLQLAIHNQISYVYYLLEQNQLAADELEIALAISEKMQSDDYLVTLYNLIDAYLDAGEVDMAQSRIAIYQQHMSEQSSVWEQWLLHYANSYHALLIKDFDKIIEIKNQIAQLGPTDSPVFTDKINIIQGLACFELGQYECVKNIVTEHFSEQDYRDIRRLKLLELIIKWHGYQGNSEQMMEVQQYYFSLTQQKLFAQQQAAKVLGVAKLNNEVIRLSSEETAKQLSYQNEINRLFIIALAISLVMLLVFVVAYIRLKRRLFLKANKL